MKMNRFKFEPILFGRGNFYYLSHRIVQDNNIMMTKVKK